MIPQAKDWWFSIARPVWPSLPQLWYARLQRLLAPPPPPRLVEQPLLLGVHLLKLVSPVLRYVQTRPLLNAIAILLNVQLQDELAQLPLSERLQQLLRLLLPPLRFSQPLLLFAMPPMLQLALFKPLPLQVVQPLQLHEFSQVEFPPLEA